MAVDVTPEQHGLHVGVPHALFPTPWIADLLVNPSGQAAGYAPSADGQRFLMTHQTTPEPQQIDLIFNWPALLKEEGAEGHK